ncbi:YfiT family bacillithiol transferase [Zavarzinella formosa]|uniref:YfiT family bacillithiol transferase n=1 Tax=Zavarzinella formosa TaxID=360055 RepID=UPI000315CE11|nr:putative metal-dependent hydrolase [Zavarzinella formosa]
MTTPPKYPAGERGSFTTPTVAEREAMIDDIASLAANLRKAIAGLSAEQLATKYVNWDSKRIISHLADSHMNAFARFKFALTEENPTIKPYKQWEWSLTADADTDPELSIALIEALHARWVVLLRAMTDSDFQTTFYHPEPNKTYTLAEGLHIYAWHGKHHTAQIDWMRQNYSW